MCDGAVGEYDGWSLRSLDYGVSGNWLRLCGTKRPVSHSCGQGRMNAYIGKQGAVPNRMNPFGT